MLTTVPNHSHATSTQAEAVVINYINFTPKIDGKLDKVLLGIEKHQFNEFHTFDNPINDQIKVTYSLAFNESHLYIYIETNSNEISYNKRGYLYGDGYKVILGKLKQQGQADEYYDLYYSPSLTMDKWDRGTIGTYNFKHISKPLSNDSQSMAAAHQASSGFEALIAWKDIHPINPFFMHDIGFNIYFAKYIGIENTHGYSVKKDESIWDEEEPKRNLAPITFKFPDTPIFARQIYQRNYHPGEDLKLKISKNTGATTLDLRLSNMDPVAKTMHSTKIKLTSSKTLTATAHSIETLVLATGDYKLSIFDKDQLIENETISILPAFNFAKRVESINQCTNDINKKALTTLLFKIERLNKMLSQLKPYEIASKINAYSQLVNNEINSFTSGNDPYANITKPYRRAFRSKIDGTLQPYSIKLPDNYDADKKYPLLVFLHGSGHDEQRLLNQARGDGQFIELAPLGRDLFKAYSFENSQIDIKEAIDDAIKNFSVDSKRIIIGGFSMGGYGALRAYHQNPGLYQGVAIFAGHPDLANAWGVSGIHPDFTHAKYAQILKPVPVFIYHGTDDEAINFKLVIKMRDTFTQLGIDVTTSFVEGRGHVYQDDKTNDLYHQWLKQFK